MSAFEVGRVCVKLSGREAARRCVVVDVIDRNYVLVTGPAGNARVKRRRANMSHLEPLEIMLDIKKGSSDEEVKKALEELNKRGHEGAQPLGEAVAPSL